MHKAEQTQEEVSERMKVLEVLKSTWKDGVAKGMHKMAARLCEFLGRSELKSVSISNRLHGAADLNDVYDADDVLARRDDRLWAC